MVGYLPETARTITYTAETWQLAEPLTGALPKQLPHEPHGFMG